jgi:hypothetical protein
MPTPTTNGITDYDPMLWGPAGWKFLHFISFSYPVHPTPEHKQQYDNFFRSLAHVLPCKTCRHHYQLRLNAAPRDSSGSLKCLTSRKTLSEWLVDLHNAVNTNNRKKRLDYELIKHQYETTANLCNSPTRTGSYVNLVERRARAPPTPTTTPLDDDSMSEWVVPVAIILLVLSMCGIAIWYNCDSCQTA